MRGEVFLNAGNLEFVEQQYQRYLEDPDSVELSWRRYFEDEVPIHQLDTFQGLEIKQRSIFNPEPSARPCPGWQGPEEGTACSPVCGQALRATVRLSRIFQMVNNYRVRGHLLADLDPLGQREIKRPPELELAYYGFTEVDLEALVPNGGYYGPSIIKLRELHEALEATYCRYIGVEFMNIQDPVQKNWLLERMERSRNRHKLSRDDQIAILTKLVAAEGLEQFLHTKYVGTKRFSLQGSEALIPMLDVIVEAAGRSGIDEIVMGMPHRGRLNVVVNTLGQEPSSLFAQFEDIDPMATLGSGDVKYHLGFCTADHFTRRGKRMHISLTSNPSHLEAVNPVVEGRARAKQDRRRDYDREMTLPILIHGDAAFAGQGLVAETLNLAGLEGYRTGGTIHIIVNNQIGFTTPPQASRSTPYSTDVARMMQVPIFHVNGEDVESVVQVAQLAMEYRQTFRKDAVIDMFCWRKYGHNEMDEPSFTQPMMYKAIDTHPSINRVYSDQMVSTGQISREEAEAIVVRERERLEEDLRRVREAPITHEHRPKLRELWEGYRGGPDSLVPDVETSVPRETLDQIAVRLETLPDEFSPHRKIKRLIDQRSRMARGELSIDWGMGEMLAFGSLLWEGTTVRLSGQDSRRGTFSHRHTVFVDVNNGAQYSPLANLTEGQGEFFAYDSSLSEAGVLGFEFGYSMNAPAALVIWEAQFGDFANGAQVIIDQFIASSEDKWGRLSGLVMFLPHGHEGQGPEHSSARLERFLQLCARDNMQVCIPTTPAQHFHMLRRQVRRRWRKPLVVMTPKSLLRHPSAVSSIEDLTDGSFHKLLVDEGETDPKTAQRLLLCSGKLYYELAGEREKRGLGEGLPIVRVEQLYPFPGRELADLLGRYPRLEEVSWVQEEPRNMGAWEFMRSRFASSTELRVHLVGHTRAEAASPATGSHKAHLIEQRLLLKEVFGG